MKDNIKLVPELRFPEFEGEWVQKKMSDLFIINAGGDVLKKNVSKVKTAKFKYPIYANAEKNKGLYGFSDIYKVEGKTLTIAGRGVHIGIAHTRNEKYFPIVRLLVLKPKTNQIVKFFEYQFNNQNIYIESTGVPQLTSPQVSIYKVYSPSLPEQQKIANFLTAIDNRIQILEKKKTLLEQYKKGMMQKIFSQEIRFKDDDEKAFPSWEVKKLRDLITFSNGKGHEKYIRNKGKFIVVNSKFISTNGKVRKYCDSQISPLQKRSIVMVMSDVPNGKALAKCFLIDEDDKYTLNQRICSLFEKTNTNNEYLIFILNRNKYYLKFDSGVGQTNLKKNEVLNCPVNLPCYSEQTKIANFLTAIDKKIELVNQQLEHSKTYKKGLLQKMFV